LVAAGAFCSTGSLWAADSGNESPESPGIRYTLAESVEQALRANPQVEAADYALEGAGSEVGIARGQMLPSLTLTAGRSVLNSISASGQVDVDQLEQRNDNLGLQFSQTLFAGMTLLKGHQKAQLNEERVEAEKKSVEARLILEVQTKFFNLLKARGEVSALKDALQRLQAGVEAAQAFSRVRLAPYVDVLQAEADLADTRQRLSRARVDEANLRVQLNALLGLPARSPTHYQGDLLDLRMDLPWTLDQCLDRAETQRADLEVARKTLATAQKQAEMVLGRHWPKIDLKAGYIHQDRDFDQPGRDIMGGAVDRDYRTDYWTAGINLEWRLFEGGRTHYEHRRARAEIGRLRANLRGTRDQVVSEIETSYQSMTEARERIDSAEVGLDLARENHERAQKRFDSRVGTIIELLDAQERLTRAEISLTQARADYQTALANLLYAMGERNPELRF
jgi:outer membrane protein TolC